MTDLDMTLLDYYVPTDRAVVARQLLHILFGKNIGFSLNGEVFRSIL